MTRSDVGPALAGMEERIIMAIASATDRIVGAIREASAEGTASREAMADAVLQRGAAFLRAALDEGTGRAVVLGPEVGNDNRTPGPTTPPGGPANDDAPEDEPPRSGPPPASTPRPSR